MKSGATLTPVDSVRIKALAKQLGVSVKLAKEAWIAEGGNYAKACEHVTALYKAGKR